MFPFLDFAPSGGPMIGTIVVVALLATICVIVGLALRKSLTGRKIDISIMGKFVTVKVEDSNAERSALLPGTAEAPVELHGGSRTSRRDQPFNPAP
ncbi:hypothetical protein SAMN05216188_104241 [Lentzea xinjiangensis]|uniref:Uncharacterized protein n=1 Tax=Lentzea xinjiangensis TaxID=402600 RepID=A0A1H9HWX6_9PSEU|nr:hypothetical protein [Lentzea xinjiangensis]SEQ66893.1 hypothetical protein SAMN05216188_104241 [Lentzea xinjiangensis]